MLPGFAPRRLVASLYHGLRGPAKALFRGFDHQAIYLLIAGTCTPFSLVSLRPSVGWWLSGTVWDIALIGVVPERCGVQHVKPRDKYSRYGYACPGSAVQQMIEEVIPMPDDQSSPPQADGSMPGISRREVLMGLGASAALGFSGTVSSAMPGHDHSKHAPRHGDLLDAVNGCVSKGQNCIAHCLVSFREGDLALADCASKVHEMQAICTAFSYLLASNSGYLAEYYPVCEAVCRDCARECRKHDEHHECRACAEACEAVVDAIKLTFAA